jgi:hypothetical protein
MMIKWLGTSKYKGQTHDVEIESMTIDTSSSSINGYGNHPEAGKFTIEGKAAG